MNNPNTFNKLSIMLLVLTLLNFFGGGPLNIVGIFIPYWIFVYFFVMFGLLIVSCIQIIKYKEKGSILNIITTFNLLVIFLVIINTLFNGDFFDDLSRYNKPEIINTMLLAVGACLIIAAGLSVLKNFKKK